MSEPAWGYRWEHRADRMIGKAPPDEIRMYLPWAGHSPLGEEIIAEATAAWEKNTAHLQAADQPGGER